MYVRPTRTQAMRDHFARWTSARLWHCARLLLDTRVHVIPAAFVISALWASDRHSHYSGPVVA